MTMSVGCPAIFVGEDGGLGRGECDGLEILRFLGMISGSHPVSLRVREV